MKLILGRSVTVALMSTPLAAQAQFFGSFDNNTVLDGAAIRAVLGGLVHYDAAILTLGSGFIHFRLG
jgi:hypothetical protein